MAKNRDSFLRAAIIALLEAKHADGGYIGYEADIQEAITSIEQIRTHCNTIEAKR